MLESSQRLPTLEDIRNYVADTLSQLETLEPSQHQLSQQVLHRSGAPCGIEFCLHGPRSVRLTAIWETDRNTILFYSSRGERVLRTRLLAAPDVDAAISNAA
jgi:hypothetical protein